MNAKASLKSWNLDVDQFLVVFPGDDVSFVSRNRADIEHEIASAACPFRVIWFNAHEGWSRDVSDEFGPSDDDEDDDAAGIPSPDSLRRWHEGRAL